MRPFWETSIFPNRVYTIATIYISDISHFSLLLQYWKMEKSKFLKKDASWRFNFRLISKLDMSASVSTWKFTGKFNLRWALVQDQGVEGFSMLEESFSLPPFPAVKLLLHPKITLEKNTLRRIKNSSVFNKIPRGEVSTINSTKFILEEATLMTEWTWRLENKLLMIDLKRLVKLTSVVNLRKNHWKLSAILLSLKKISRLFSKLFLSLSDIWCGTQVSISRGSKSIFTLSLFTSRSLNSSRDVPVAFKDEFTKEWRRVVNFKTFSSPSILFSSNKLFSISDLPFEFLNHMSIKISFYHFKMNCHCLCCRLTFDFFVTF